MKPNRLVNVFSKRVYFPGSFFFIIAIPLIILAAAAVRFDQTKYAATVTSKAILRDSISFEEKEQRQDEKAEAFPTQSGVSNFGNPKLQADIATFVLWGFVGIIIYFLCNTIFVLFIHPVFEDLKDLTYVNAKTAKIGENRLFWIMAMLFTAVSAIATIAVFRFVVLTYYSIALYEANIVNIALLIAGVVLDTLLFAFAVVGAHAVSKST